MDARWKPGKVWLNMDWLANGAALTDEREKRIDRTFVKYLNANDLRLTGEAHRMRCLYWLCDAMDMEFSITINFKRASHWITPNSPFYGRKRVSHAALTFLFASGFDIKAGRNWQMQVQKDVSLTLNAFTQASLSHRFVIKPFTGAAFIPCLLSFWLIHS